MVSFALVLEVDGTLSIVQKYSMIAQSVILHQDTMIHAKMSIVTKATSMSYTVAWLEETLNFNKLGAAQNVNR